MARGGDALLQRLAGRAAHQQADGSPGLGRVQTIHVVARRHAGLAARAGVQVHVEGVLLARARRRRRQQRAVASVRRMAQLLVQRGEAVDRRPLAQIACNGTRAVHADAQVVGTSPRRWHRTGHRRSGDFQDSTFMIRLATPSFVVRPE
jgi:hypothetical protein